MSEPRLRSIGNYLVILSGPTTAETEGNYDSLKDAEDAVNRYLADHPHTQRDRVIIYNRDQASGVSRVGRIAPPTVPVVQWL